MTTQIDRRFDFSGGIQTATTWQLRKQNEVEDTINGRFNDVIGSITRRLGYTLKGAALENGKRGLGIHESKWTSGAKTLAAINNSGDTETKIKIYDNGASTWSNLTLPTALDPNTHIQMIDSIGETYVAGQSTSTGNRMQPLNIVSGSPPTVSSTRSLINVPKAKYIAEYSGSLYAINVEIGGTIYADRAYKSSPALGIVTFTQGSQEDVEAPVDFIDNVPTMTSNTAPIGVASASNEASAAFAAWKAFDDDTTGTNEWSTTATLGVGQLQYDFGASNSKTITYYSMVGIGQGESAAANLSPKTWTFEGSNNAVSWTVLDTQTNAANFLPGEKRVYSITNTTAYRYYRVNVTVNQGNTNLTISELELLTSSQGTKDLQLKVDSVRYIKAGMVFDIYKSSTNIKKFTVTINSVDKINNTFTFTPYSLNFATGDVNTGTDTITLSSTTNFPTGTTIKFNSSGTVPAGLTADTLYYAINTSSTTIKVATSYSNALLGVGIDITSTGSGTHTIRLSYSVLDNDEIWLTGRYGERYYMWNTDYPTEQKSDFIEIPPGIDSDSDITAWAKTNNRLLLYTKNSMMKYDGANPIVIYEDIGCISYETIQNIGDWVIWLDAEGKIRARNDATGQDELISKRIQNLLRDIPDANLVNAAAGRVDNVYKICLGTVNGTVLRLCYDFDSNGWAHESHLLSMVNHLRSDMDGSKKLYFISDAGQMYTDESGYTDNGITIPFIVKLGRTNQSNEQKKNYHGVYVYSQNIAGASLKASLDGNLDLKDYGQLKQELEKIPLSVLGVQASARDINVTISINSDGESPRIDGIVYYFSQEEDKFGQPTKR